MASTTRKQRIGIWVIVAFMLVGTVLSSFILIIANQNSAEENRINQAKYEKFEAAYKDYTEKLDAQNTELSQQYYETMKSYSSYAAKFDGSSVKSLGVKDLLVGSGDEIKTGTQYSAYYVGWTPDGKIFDSSIDSENSNLKSPLDGTIGLIKGWTEGVIGMKMGGVRELTIPADQAYGSTGSGSIEPNTPLKFIIMAIKTPDKIEEPNYQDYI